MNWRIAIFSIMLLATIGCENKKAQELPPPPIERQKFIHMLIDIHLADAFFSVLRQDEKKRFFEFSKRSYEECLKKFEEEDADFQQTMDFYLEQPAMMDSLYMQVVEEMLILESELKKQNEEMRKKAQ